MSEQESFLARWSRRKRKAGQERSPDEEQTAASVVDAGTEPAPPIEDECAELVRADAERKTDAVQAPAIDLAKLPPIDSITAATDIRPFLAAGVPEELKYAALRRAWVADPSIRDFVGMAENQWDFTVPGGAPGFGPLLPVDDVRRLVAEVLGDQPAAAPENGPHLSASHPQPAAVTQESASLSAPDEDAQRACEVAVSHDAVTSDVHASPSEAEPDVIAQNSNDAALQKNEDDGLPSKQSVRRTHGSALPE